MSTYAHRVISLSPFSTLILGGYLDSVSRDIDFVNRKVLPK